MRGKDPVEILEGLETGAEVVVAANFLIDAESNLKAALSTFSEPKASAAAKSYSAMGSVDTVDAANNTISMNHEAIPALKWPAMTMEFGLADGNVAKGLLPGQAVHFSFEDRGNGEFVIVRLEKMDGKTTTSHQGAH